MNLPRTFVSFSSSDIRYYHMMRAWKASENIDFNCADFQLEERINSSNSYYIKTQCSNKIRRSDTFVLLIGNDTYTKTEYVKAEVEAAVEKGCRLIGVNLNHSRAKDHFCPSFFANKGAIFVPFSSKILSKALFSEIRDSGDWYYNDDFYRKLGYELKGSKAVIPPPPNPFAFGKPPWAK